MLVGAVVPASTEESMPTTPIWRPSSVANPVTTASPATYRGYAKAITGERMRRWHGVKLRDVTASALREWISEMDCTSKAIRNLLIPVRSVFEDALNNDLIEANPFDRIALTKLIKQTAKASDYVIQPFTSDERAKLLQACRAGGSG